MIQDPERIFSPTPRQQQAMMAIEHADEIGYGGALGGGKTVTICWFAHYMSTAYPGNEGAIFRDTLSNLRDTTLAEFKRYMARYYPQQPVRWRMSPSIECEIQCANGQWSRILWRETSDDPENKILSLNIGWAAIDEASQTSLAFINTLRGRVGRHLLPDLTRPPCKILWGSNPGPSWCKNDFPVGALPKKRKVKLDNGSEIVRAFVPALHFDNPHLPPDYIPKLRATYPESWLKKFLEGNWDAFEGQVFTEFDENKHVLTYQPDRDRMAASRWFHIFSLDWGIRSPAAGLLCSIDGDGEWWIWNEYYKAGKSHLQAAPELKETMLGINCVQVIDYAATDQSSGFTVMDLLNREGFHFQKCHKKKHGSDGSITFFKSLLQENAVHISPVCVNLIREIKNARWKPLSAVMLDKKNDPEEMVDKDDHALDALFYAFEHWRARGGKNNVKIDEMAHLAKQRAARAEDARVNTLQRRENDGSFIKKQHSGWRI